jgi:hypothetical protein
MFLRTILLAGSMCAIAAPACAGDLIVAVTTPDGKPLADAADVTVAPGASRVTVVLDVSRH